MIEFVAKTPLGTPLEWHTTQSREMHTRRTFDYINRVKSCDKKTNPVVITKTRDASLVVVDQDGLSCEDYAKFCVQVGDDQVFLGNSGRPKTAFWVLHPNKRFTTKDAIASIEWRYGAEFASKCDAAGTLVCFATSSFDSALPMFKVGEAKFAHRELHHWKRFEGRITAGLVHYLLDKHPRVEIAIRHLLGNSTYLKAGSFDLAGTYLADQGKMSKSEAYRILRMLQDDGMLELVDGTYCKGKKAKTYGAKGLLLSAAAYVLLSLSNTPHQGTTIVPNPTRYHWNADLWAAANYFKTESDYLNWGLSLPGIDERGRRAKLKSTWKSHARRNNVA